MILGHHDRLSVTLGEVLRHLIVVHGGHALLQPLPVLLQDLGTVLGGEGVSKALVRPCLKQKLFSLLLLLSD